jgi:hypothetical protein
MVDHPGHHQICKVIEVAGVTSGTRDPTHEPDEKSLKETYFAWVPPLPNELCTGIINDDQVPLQRAGTSIWPKLLPHSPRLRCVIKSGGGKLPDDLHLNQNVSPFKDIPDDSTPLISTLASKYKLPKIDVRAEEALPYVGNVSSNLYVEADAADSPPRVIGLYLYGVDIATCLSTRSLQPPGFPADS